MATVLNLSERVILHNISWVTYERLLADFENSSAPRITYDRGTLEIMSPLPEHEKYNRRIALLVEVVADALGIDVEDFGSTTFKREDLAKGFEPDSCFYIQNEARVRGKSIIDLHVDPPPDLVVEVDITSGSLNKLPIYAQIGIPEVWRYDGKRLILLVLEGAHYVEQEQSRVLPPLSATILSRFLEDSQAMPRTAWIRMLREWIRKSGSGS